MSILLAAMLMTVQPTPLAQDPKVCAKLDKRWQRKSDWGEFWYGFNHPTPTGLRTTFINSSTKINGQTYSSTTRVSWIDPTTSGRTYKMAEFHSPQFMEQRRLEYTEANCEIPDK